MQDFHSRWLVHQDLYYRVALMILGDSVQAMDIVQEVYLKLWKSRDLLDNVRSPEAYGASLVRNLCIDYLRHKNLHPLSPIDDNLAITSNETSEGKIIADEITKTLKRAMGKMNESQRELVRLKYFEGLDYDEIQRQTGLSAVNIRVSLARARKIIKRMMDDE